MTIRTSTSRSLFLLALLLLSLMATGSQQPVVSQDQVILPKYVTQTQTYTAGSGNDLYFRGTSYLDVFDDYILSSTTKAKVNEYKELVYSGNQATISPNSPFTLDHNRISQLHNDSNTPMTVTFENYYYDLFGNINVSELGNDFMFDGVIPLYSGVQYGFAVTANGTDPLALSITLSSAASPTVDFTFWAVSPDFENPGTFSRTITVGVETLIPLLFPQSGTYIIVFKPDASALLSSLKIYKDIPVYDFTDGIAETLRGTSSMIKFFKISPENATLLFRFFLEAKAYDYILDTSQYNQQPNVNYLGNLVISYYNFPANGLSTMFPFGLDIIWATAFGSLLFAGPNFPLYISVIAEPPNDNDPSVRVIKQDIGLPPGYEFQYSLWADSKPIPSLPLDTSFLATPQFTSTTINTYLYSITQDTILSLNSTSNTHADIYSLETLDYYTLSSTSHDSLHSSTDDLFILPAGDYLVMLHKNSYVYFTELSFTTLDPPDLSEGQLANSTLDFESVLKRPLFIKLPTERFTQDQFIFEYLDRANRSVELVVSVYDSTGNYLSSSLNQFEFIGNDVDPEWSVDNSTVIIPSELNVKGQFLRIYQSTNALYNTSTSNPKTEPLLDQNDPDLVSNFRITRQDYIAFLNATAPTLEYFALPLENTTIPELNQTLTISAAFFVFNPEPGAYRITGLATNFTISTVSFWVDSIYAWFPSVTINSVTINGTTYDSFEIELAIDTPDQYGLIVGFNPPASVNNGTFSLTIEELPIYNFPSLEFTEIPTTPYSTPSAKQPSEGGVFNWVKSNPLLSGGLALFLIALVAGGAVFYVKRKK